MAYIVKNQSGESKTWCGQLIENGAQYSIQSIELGKWANDDDVLASIVAGDAVINDGEDDFTSPTLAINYLKNVEEMDNSGRKVVKTAAAQKGATYLANMCRVTTSSGIKSLKWDGSAGDYSVKFYDSNNAEVAADNAGCVKTIVTMSPGIDYEIISGKVHVAEKATQDVEMWVIGGATDLSAYPGTVVEMIRNINFKYIQEGLISDGRASKFMSFSTEGVPVPTNKLQFIITHPAGHNYSFLVSVEMFR